MLSDKYRKVCQGWEASKTEFFDATALGRNVIIFGTATQDLLTGLEMESGDDEARTVEEWNEGLPFHDADIAEFGEIEGAMIIHEPPGACAPYQPQLLYFGAG